MKKIILSLILSLAILGCDSSFLIVDRVKKSGQNAGERILGEVCYSNDSFCLPQILKSSAVDPKGDYIYPDANKGAQYRKPIFLIDLREQNLNSKISSNFKAIDYISFEKGPYAILSRILVQAMQRLRDELKRPVFINSGYRSPGYNKGIGGSSKISRHTYGDAVDFKASNSSFEELQDLCEKHGASFTLVYRSHIHCDWRSQPLDPAFYPAQLDRSKILPIPYHEVTGGRIAHRIVNNKIEFFVEDFFEEEPGDFVYDWFVVSPSGEEFNSTNANIILNPESGAYSISVQVGNSVQLDEIFEW